MRRRNLVFAIFTLSSLTLGMFGCNGEANLDEIEIRTAIDTISNNKLEEIESFLAVEPTSYSLDPSKDTLLTCEKGTQLFFPANCFAFADLSAITETIEIKVKEYYEYAEFIGENLTTTSNGALLETGGMINISATSEGKEIAIKPDESYKIYFPKNGNEQEMELFYGVHDSANNINWNLAAEPNLVPAALPAQTGLTLPASLNPSGMKYKYDVRVSHFTSAVLYFPVQWKFLNGQDDVFSYTKSNFVIPSGIGDSLNYSNSVLQYELDFDERGVIKNIETIELNPAKNNPFDGLAREFMMSWTPIDMSTMESPDHKTTFRMGFIITRKQDYSNYSESIEKQYGTEETLEEIDQSDLNYYVLGASQLGWINCDRF